MKEMKMRTTHRETFIALEVSLVMTTKMMLCKRMRVQEQPMITV